MYIATRNAQCLASLRRFERRRMSSKKDDDTVLIRPGNETELHFLSKQHLRAELVATPPDLRRLQVTRMCSTRQEHETMLPYWTCTNSITEPLIDSWQSVEQEWPVKGIGKFDVALFDKKSLSLALEVFHKGKVSDDKIKKLQRRKIKWIEIRTHEGFYSPGPHRWSPSKPLVAYRSSMGSYTCPTCQKGPQNVTFTRIAAIADVFLSRGQMTRKVYSVFERSTTGEQYLVQAGYHASPIEDQTIGSFLMTTAAKKEANVKLKRAVDDDIEEMMRRGAGGGAHVSVAVPWPGIPLERFFSQYGEDSMFDWRHIRTPMMLFPSMRRLVAPAMRWDPIQRQWKPNTMK